MTRFVSTLGFSGHRVTRPIIARGITAGDEVILISPVQSDPGAKEQTEQAVRNVEDTLGGVVHHLNLTTHKIPVDDFAESADRVSEILVDGSPSVVCLGAGATDILLPTFLAVLAHYSYVQDVMLFSDLQQGGVNPSVPNLTARIPGRTMDVFRALAKRMGESPATVSELADEAERSVSTASRHVDALADEGLVQKHRDEQAKTVSLTVTGRLFARNVLIDEVD
jgi:CRISPR-associated protein Csa3